MSQFDVAMAMFPGWFWPLMLVIAGLVGLGYVLGRITHHRNVRAERLGRARDKADAWWWRTMVARRSSRRLTYVRPDVVRPDARPEDRAKD